MNTLDNLWPTGVGYDRRSGYAHYAYDSEKDPLQKVAQLIESWKRTVLDHGFTSQAVKCLSCNPVEKGGYRLILALNAEPSEVSSMSFDCTVRKIDADIDLDEDPTDTCVGLVITGISHGTNSDFKYSITVYRRPTVRTHIHTSWGQSAADSVKKQ